MPKIIIDGQQIECRDHVPVLQAALEAGWDVPHYCYHPGLTVVASCRLCLMETKMPDPKTKELVWSPRLVPSCQTPVKDGMEVRFDSAGVKQNREHCMEYYLLNHPLDCPVCDQAGECYLQDYSYKFGHATSRMVEAKTKNPKKDVGSKTLLYQDRCVMCTRCVRFTTEIAGTSELSVVNRGNRAEIDVFPGVPLENPLQGNVVDICPVGALLDKDFLMKQRVWMLRSADSICPGCSTGCAIKIDQNEGHVYRVKPRFNPGVNDWWMCDEGRFEWKYVHDERRITRPIVRRGADEEPADWTELPQVLRYRFTELAARHGGAKIGAMLSPFMANEEAWLLIQFIRGIAPEATLCMGPVPTAGVDETFPRGFAHSLPVINPDEAGSAENANAAPSRDRKVADLEASGATANSARSSESTGSGTGGIAGGVKPVEGTTTVLANAQDRKDVAPAGAGTSAANIAGKDASPNTPRLAGIKFTIHAEKCPNRRGIEMLLQQAGGAVKTFDDFVAAASKGEFAAVWLSAGYPKEWVTKPLATAMAKVAFVALQDMFPSDITPLAGAVLPACAWAEREGSFMNQSGLVQHFEAALPPPEGAQRDGQYLYALAGQTGLYRADIVREMMADKLEAFGKVHAPPVAPEFAH